MDGVTGMYPAGMFPASHPLSGFLDPEAALAQQFLGGAPLTMPAACSSATGSPQCGPAAAEEAQLEADMELLERILRDCHLGDVDGDAGAAAGATAAVPSAVPAAAALPSEATVAVPVQPWAEEMVRRLQGCNSPEEARDRSAELLLAFQQQQQQSFAASAASTLAPGVDPERLQKLRGANSVLLRGMKHLYQRQKEQAAQRERAEAACTLMAAELARCQEALRVSERQKGMLQYHLQLASNVPGTAAGGM